MATPVLKLNWNRIWEEFSNWCDKNEIRCKICKRVSAPCWEDQQDKIERIVRKEIKRSQGVIESRRPKKEKTNVGKM